MNAVGMRSVSLVSLVVLAIVTVLALREPAVTPVQAGDPPGCPTITMGEECPAGEGGGPGGGPGGDPNDALPPEDPPEKSRRGPVRAGTGLSGQGPLYTLLGLPIRGATRARATPRFAFPANSLRHTRRIVVVSGTRDA